MPLAEVGPVCAVVLIVAVFLVVAAGCFSLVRFAVPALLVPSLHSSGLLVLWNSSHFYLFHRS